MFHVNPCGLHWAQEGKSPMPDEKPVFSVISAQGTPFKLTIYDNGEVSIDVQGEFNKRFKKVSLAHAYYCGAVAGAKSRGETWSHLFSIVGILQNYIVVNDLADHEREISEDEARVIVKRVYKENHALFDKVAFDHLGTKSAVVDDDGDVFYMAEDAKCEGRFFNTFAEPSELVSIAKKLRDYHV